MQEDSRYSCQHWVGLSSAYCLQKTLLLNLLPAEEVLHEAAQIRIIGSVLEPQTAAVPQIGDEFARKMLAQRLDWGGHLLLHDLLVLLLFTDGAEAWEDANGGYVHIVSEYRKIVFTGYARYLLYTYITVTDSINCPQKIARIVELHKNAKRHLWGSNPRGQSPPA